MPNWPTEPPSGAVALYLFYNIWFANPEEYAAAVATFGGVSVSRSPAFMRNALGISETANGWDGVDDTWIQFVSPPWVIDFNADGSWRPPIAIKDAHAYVYPSDTSGNPYWWPPASYTFDYNQDYLVIPGHPSVPIWGAGRTLVWYWVGIFLSKTGGVSASPTTITPSPGEGTVVRQNIRPRRFATGFETTNGGQVAPGLSPEGLGGTTQSEGYCRAASRTPDGVGYLSTSIGTSESKSLNENGTPSNTLNSAERLYVKFQKWPTTATRFLTFTTDGNETFNITVDQFGALNAFVINNFAINSGPLGAGSSLALDTWYRMDSYVKFYTRPNPSGGANGIVIIKIKGSTVLSLDASVNTGFGPTTRVHGSTTVISGGNGLEVMYDDWENIDPGPSPDNSTPGPNLQEGTIDYWTGVHMQLIKNTGFNENTNWTGDYLRSMQKLPAAPLVNITSSTSGARLALDTDMDGVIGNNSRIDYVRQQGTIALLPLAAVSKGVASVTDQIGAKYNGTETVATKSCGTALQGYHTLINVSAGLLDPMPIASLEPCRPLWIKSTDANATNVVFLALEAIFMGQYGNEDAFLEGDFTVTTETIGFHNAPYWATYMGRATVPPPNTVGVAAGTYVGNGTFQTITITLPGIHFLMIRNTSTHQQTWWWSTHLGPHSLLTDDVIRPALLIDVDINDNGDTEIKLTNNDNASNASGVTYQYIAFSDVMSRCLLNIPYRQASGGGNISLLFDGNFLPEWGMFQAESVKNNSGATNMYTKGPGMTADQAKNASNVSPSATGARFATGNITELATVAGAGNTQSIALWRQYADGVSTNPNILYIGQYTGNGAGGTRNIAVTLNGRRPLFAMVIPLNNGTPFQRDPSNSGGNSNALGSTSNLANGIVGGDVDTLKVGSSLNTNLIVYSVFIIPSCTTDAGNDGWGVNGVCGLAEPGWDTPPDWTLAPPSPPADITVLGSGGIVLSGETAKLLVEQMSGIYTLIPGQRHDTIITGSSPAEENVEIPDQFFKTGYIGG